MKPWSTLAATIVLSGASLFTTHVADASAVDYFVEIDGVQGESTDQQFRNAIQIESFQFGVTNASSAAGGLASGKAQFHSLEFVKHVDKASPRLLVAAATGEHFKTLTLSARRAGMKQVVFFKVKLGDPVVRQVQDLATQADPIPAEHISIDFSRIEVEYSAQKPDGSLDVSVKGGFDLLKNQKI